MATTSDQFLIDGKSFVTKCEGDSCNVVRTATGAPLTQEEKNEAGSYFNSTTNTIDMAKIYDLDFGPNYMNQLGASNEWMALSQTSAYKNAFKKATDKTGPNISFEESATNEELLKIMNPIGLNEDANGVSTKFDGDILRYPTKQSKESSYDYLQISSYENAPDKLGYQQDKKGNYSAAAMRDYDERLADSGGPVVGRVYLPMQPGLQEQTQVSWNQDQMNALEAAGANIAGGAVEGASKSAVDSATQAAEATGKAFGDITGSINKDDVSAYFAGKAIQKNILGRTAGKAVNPNLELLFSGPTLRTFAYSYRFTPRDPEEARMIKKIIRFFKKSMSPIRQKGRVFLQTPNVFKLKYIYGPRGGQHPYLNKIKMCALQSFDVQYTPDGSYMTYGDGSMTSYQVSMSFGELNPIYAEDYDEDTISDSMGY